MLLVARLPGGPVMPVFHSKRHVHHSADEMFDLVADVERYPEFVPLCLKHVIRSREERAGVEIMITDMTVACAIFRETYSSRVTLDRMKGRIVVEASTGPLRELTTLWTFDSRPDGTCDVGFDLSYELASGTLAVLMGSVLEGAFGRFARAFQRRADVVYGRRRAAGPPRFRKRPQPTQALPLCLRDNHSPARPTQISAKLVSMLHGSRSS
jgi:coenzyme Q-binding protein COQ10